MCMNRFYYSELTSKTPRHSGLSRLGSERTSFRSSFRAHTSRRSVSAAAYGSDRIILVRHMHVVSNGGSIMRL